MASIDWSYDSSLTADRDKVRFLVGDTDDSNKLVADGEITGSLTIENDNIYKAAAMIAESLAARFAREVSITVDGLSRTGEQRARQYTDLARRLRQRGNEAAGALGAPFVGGVSKGEMNSVDSDTDRFHSRFKMGQDSFNTGEPVVERIEYPE